MVKVTVISKGGLESYAGTIASCAGEFETAIQGANSQLQVKYEGAENQAVTAFQNKLNTIAEAVFNTYPSLLSRYSQAISTYTGALEEAGFSGDVVKTKKDDIDTISDWLKSTKTEEFGTAYDELEPAYQKGAAALALEPHSVEIGASGLEDLLADLQEELKGAAEDRETKHGELTSALKVFKNELSEIQTEFEAISTYLLNAQFINSAKAADVAALLAQGRLTEENIHYLDAIQAKGDGEALKVLLSEGEDKEAYFGELGHLNATHISSPMMDLIYGRLYAEILPAEGTEDIRNIEAFLMALDDQSVKRSRIYLEKLAESGDRYSLLLTDYGRGLIPKLPAGSAGEDAFKAYKEQLEGNSQELSGIDALLTKNGHLLGLFESAYVHGIGTSKVSGDHRGPKLTKQVTLSNLSYSADGTFQYDKLTAIGNKKDYAASTITINYQSAKATALDELSSEYKALSEKRKKALSDFVSSSVTSVLPAPYQALAKTVGDAMVLANPDGALSSKVGSADSISQGLLGSRYKGTGNLQSTLSLLEQLDSLTQEQAKTERTASGLLFDTKGYTVGNSSSDVGSYSRYAPSSDLKTILQMDDLEKNGLRGYIYRSNGDNGVEAVKNFESAMKGAPTSSSKSLWEQAGGWLTGGGDSRGETALTQETKAFLSGQSGQTVGDIGATNLWDSMQATDSYLNSLSQSDNKLSFSADAYAETNADYFKDLIGGQ